MDLFQVVFYGFPSEVQQLLESGISPNFPNSDGNYPLILAAENNNLKIVDLLLKFGADPNVQNASGEFPLLNAVFSDNLQIVNLLFEHGADLNKQYPDGGDTALHISYEYQLKDMINLLISLGADPNIRNSDGLYPSDLDQITPIIKMGPISFESFVEELSKFNMVDLNPILPHGNYSILGKGSFGTVYDVSPEYAFKISRFCAPDRKYYQICNMERDNPNGIIIPHGDTELAVILPEPRIEIDFARFLSEKNLETSFIGVVGGGMNIRRGVSYLLMTKTNGSLHDGVKNGIINGEKLKILIFIIMATCYGLRDLEFMHNDLHFGNVHYIESSVPLDIKLKIDDKEVVFRNLNFYPVIGDLSRVRWKDSSNNTLYISSTVSRQAMIYNPWIDITRIGKTSSVFLDNYIYKDVGDYLKSIAYMMNWIILDPRGYAPAQYLEDHIFSSGPMTYELITLPSYPPNLLSFTSDISNFTYVNRLRVNKEMCRANKCKWSHVCCGLNLYDYMKKTQVAGFAVNASYFNLSDFVPIGPTRLSNDIVFNNPIPKNYEKYYGIVQILETGPIILPLIHLSKVISQTYPYFVAGPLLVSDGVPIFTESNNIMFTCALQPMDIQTYGVSNCNHIEPGELSHSLNPNPRTILCNTYSGDVLFLLIEGRGKRGHGIDLIHLTRHIETLAGQPILNAINLDGGQSSNIIVKRTSDDIPETCRHNDFNILNTYIIGNLIHFTFE